MTQYYPILKLYVTYQYVLMPFNDAHLPYRVLMSLYDEIVQMTGYHPSFRGPLIEFMCETEDTMVEVAERIRVTIEPYVKTIPANIPASWVR